MRRRVVVSNDALIAEVARLIGEGERVTILTKGSSMLPFIVGGRDSVELNEVDSPILVGDIILARVEGASRYVIHRVVRVARDGEITLMGDGNLGGKERCRYEDVVARVVSIVKPKRVVDPFSVRSLLYAKIWRLLLPIRRYLLAVRRRVV